MTSERRHDEPPGAADLRDDWLERVLGEDAAAHRDAYLADDGFTARVMASLPAPASSPVPAWRKPAVVVLWGVAAAGLAVAMPGFVVDVGREAYRLLATQPVSLSGIAGAAAALIGLTWAGAAYALRVTD